MLTHAGSHPRVRSITAGEFRRFTASTNVEVHVRDVPHAQKHSLPQHAALVTKPLITIGETVLSRESVHPSLPELVKDGYDPQKGRCNFFFVST